jgi:hypothetical protein
VVGATLGGLDWRRVAAQTPWEGPRILDYGFFQERQILHTGYLVENPNAGVGLSDMEFELEARDSAGTVLETTSGYVEWLAPGQQTGVSTGVFLSSGQVVAGLAIRVMRVNFRPLDGFVVQDARFVQERSLSYVRGSVANPFPRAVENLNLAALFYDGDGRLMGGDTGSIRSVPAGGTAAAELTLLSAVRPAAVALYAFMGISSRFTD